MKTIILSLVLFLTISCNNSESDNNFSAVPLTSILIGKGGLAGNGTEGIPQQNIVITNQTVWNSLLNSMNSFTNVSNSFSSTTIDFANFQLVAIFGNIMPTGNEVNISNVIENANNITISIQTVDRDSAVINQPFCIVKIPKSIKPLVFQ